MSESLADLKLAWFREATELTSGSLADVEFAYWSGLSELTPVAEYSLADHMSFALEGEGSLSDRYRLWLEAEPHESTTDAEWRKFNEPPGPPRMPYEIQFGRIALKALNFAENPALNMGRVALKVIWVEEEIPV